jgi:hypothetical protein
MLRLMTELLDSPQEGIYMTSIFRECRTEALLLSLRMWVGCTAPPNRT